MKTMANKPNDKATHKQRESGKRKVQDQFDKKNQKRLRNIVETTNLYGLIAMK